MISLLSESIEPKILFFLIGSRQIRCYCTTPHIFQEAISNSLADAPNKGSLGESDELQEKQLQKAIQLSLEGFREQCGMESPEATSSTSENNKALEAIKESEQNSSKVPQSEEIRRKRENFLRRLEK